MKALRYANLEHEIERTGARRLLEIGTCRGERAQLMICAALIDSPHNLVEYHGFDLFETPPEEEFSARTPPASLPDMEETLSRYGVKVRLYQGDSKKTLPESGLSNIDLAFIDGGHSDETVRADFENVLKVLKPRGSIMLDDFWNYPGGGGCNALVRSLDTSRFEVSILPPIDSFAKPYGTLKTQMVRVIPR